MTLECYSFTAAWISRNSDINPMNNVVAALAVVVVIVIIIVVIIVIVIIVIIAIYADFFSSATIWSSILKGDVCGLER